jgi:NAD+ synthase
MDLCLYGKNNEVSAREVAAAVELSEEQVERVYADIDAKRNGTRYLHFPPVLMGEVPEIKVGKA